jgi:RNA polymerase-binding protein DksA
MPALPNKGDTQPSALRGDKVDIQAIEKALKAKRDELLHRADRLHRDVHNRDEPYHKDFAEQAVELENLEVLLELDRETRLELKNVLEALARIEDDEYGICQSCGEAISEARLQVLPYIQTCIGCADALEKSG